MLRTFRQWIFASAAVLLLGGIVSVRALTEPKNDFRFAIMGDRTGSTQPGIYEKVWREVDRLQPNFVINVGDTIEGANDARAEAEWQELRPLFDRYKRYPLYFTPGNHDIWSDHSRRVYVKQTGQQPFYSFDYQDAHFTVLDNSRDPDLNPVQLGFLLSDLEENRAKDPKFVFFHRPFWIVNVSTQNRDFDLHELATKFNVRYVISGHAHKLVHLKLDGVTYLAVGSSGGALDHGMSTVQEFQGGSFFQHISARVKGSKVELTVKEIDPPAGKGRAFPIEDWDINGPRFDPANPDRIVRPLK